MRRRWLVAALAALCCACSDSSGPSDSTHAYLRVLNTWSNGSYIDALVDGQEVMLALATGTASQAVTVAPGMHDVGLRLSGSVLHAPVPLTISFSAGDTVTLFASDSSGAPYPWVFQDTGSVVPAGKSKLRVVHFASSHANALFFRTQPDDTAPVSVMDPFTFGEASPYLQSDPGVWKVFMSSVNHTVEGDPIALDTLSMSTNINIPAGESRTIVFYDVATMNGSRIISAVFTP